jgi:hypothetical protein
VIGKRQAGIAMQPTNNESGKKGKGAQAPAQALNSSDGDGASKHPKHQKVQSKGRANTKSAEPDSSDEEGAHKSKEAEGNQKAPKPQKARSKGAAAKKATAATNSSAPTEPTAQADEVGWY